MNDLADKICEEFQLKSKKYVTPAEYLLQFLTDYNRLELSQKARSRQNFGTISEDENQKKRKQRIGRKDRIPMASEMLQKSQKINVQKVLKKAMQAAHKGASKSAPAQSHSVAIPLSTSTPALSAQMASCTKNLQSTHTTRIQQYIRNNNIPQSNGHIHLYIQRYKW